MQIAARELLAQLDQVLAKSTLIAEKFKPLSAEQLNFKSSPTSWSILECLEHLNLYGDFYIPEIERRIIEAKNPSPSLWERIFGNRPAYQPENGIFKSNWLGDMCVKAVIIPADGKIKKMSSPKDKNPVYVASALDALVIDRFLKQQARWHELLKAADSIDLVRTHTSISLSRWVTLRLGDTFRFLIYHIERHCVQAENVLNGL